MNPERFIATRNACKLCTPLGASWAFKGIKNCVTILHGSQGCSTYIRRYMISHFKEPLDIASSNFSEDTAIFGGGDNLKTAMRNVIRQYDPEILGIATTCLSETIGDDVPAMIRAFLKEEDTSARIVHVSTPSYKGTHAEGFYHTTRALVEQLARGGEKEAHINCLAGMLSPADLRLVREVHTAFGLDTVLCPDYSDTLDGGMWEDYQTIPEGGTSWEELESMGRARATLEFGHVSLLSETGGDVLEKNFGVANHQMGIPIGIEATDKWMHTLAAISGHQLPAVYAGERARLIDAYADGHKYVFGLKAAIYGEEDLIVALALFLAEIGIIPVVAASGASSKRLKEELDRSLPPHIREQMKVQEDEDFIGIEQTAREESVDIVIGNSKGYKMADALGVPLIRVGFPVHDRFGGQRIKHIGYEGSQELFDRIVNAVLAKSQGDSPWGYFYL